MFIVPVGSINTAWTSLVRNRAVLRSARNNEQLARPEHDVAVAELDRQLAGQDEE